mgnify:CR=1 FL=1
MAKNRSLLFGSGQELGSRSFTDDDQAMALGFKHILDILEYTVRAVNHKRHFGDQAQILIEALTQSKVHQNPYFADEAVTGRAV